MTEFHRVAYIMSRFPGLSETFILREMCEMERIGWQLELYPLIYQEEVIIHDEAKSWLNKAKRPRIFSILRENIQRAFFNPRLYFSVLFRVFTENRKSPKFLSRAIIVFPKAVWMARQMQNEQVTHIHCHYATHSALAAWIINQISGIPYGITVHAHDIFVDQTMLYRKLFDAKYIISISEYNKKFLVGHFGDWVSQKISIVHCGIYPDKYKSSQNSFERSGQFKIISIGSLRPYKGFTYLLEACQLIKQAGVNFKCYIIGGGELRRSLETKILDLNISDVVELMGPKNQAEIASLLPAADCYIQPSIITPSGKMEGIPVSLMEAMACCIPVIATNISGIPELVLDGETGWLIPPKSPNAILESVMQVYNQPQKASIIAKQGKELVLREFDIMKSTSSLSLLFESLKG